MTDRQTRPAERWRARVRLFVALLCAAAGPASAQLQTGDLFGTARDSRGRPLSGAIITLAGPGAPRTQSADSRGEFGFLGLDPGEYVLEAELDGYSPVEQRGIGIRIGSRSTLEVVLDLALDETVSVSSEVALLHPRGPSQGPALSLPELDQIPRARDLGSLLREAPGARADRIDVGGNESGRQPDFAAAGALSTDNAFALDGVVLTDMAAAGRSAIDFDLGADEEVQLTVSSTDVAISTAGITINQVTRRGGDTWRGGGRYLRTEGSWQAEPEEVDGGRIDAVEEYGLDLGGPLAQDHLWVWTAGARSDIGTIAPGGQPDRTELESFDGKLNFSLGASSGVLQAWTHDRLEDGRNAGRLFSPASTWNQKSPSDTWKVEAGHLFTPHLLLSGLYSAHDGTVTLEPEGGLDADMFLDEEGVAHGSYRSVDQSTAISQSRIDGSAFLGGGRWNHELKFGAGARDQENDSISVLPRGRSVHACEDQSCEPIGDDGHPRDDVELVVWTRRNVAVATAYDSAWFQDTISTDRWTIAAGLRYDRQTGLNRAHFDAGNPEAQGYLPPIEFPGNDADGLDWRSIVPRAGLTYALGEERRTLLRGTYSRYAAQLGQSLVSRIDPLATHGYVEFYFTDANRNLVFDPEEDGSLSYFGLSAVNAGDPSSVVSPHRNDPDLDPHLTDEVTLALQHLFENDLGVSATLQWRNSSGLLELRELVVDGTGAERVANRDDYVLTSEESVPLPGGGSATVADYDLRAGLSRTGGLFLTNGDRELDFLGLTLGFQKPMANRWMVRGSFTWSDSKLRVGPEFERHDDPTDVVFTAGDGSFGSYGDDADDFAFQSADPAKRGVVLQGRWSFHVDGAYRVAPDRPWGFELAAAITGRQGYPSPAFVGTDARQLQLTADLDDFRHEDVVTVDLRIAKELELRDLALTGALDVFNLFDRQPVLQSNRDFDHTRERFVVERLSPRAVRWSLTLHYR